ncbi:hypothetical protein JTB14_034559 [Gonioctena quinquepunctata]|nr:hypothetical protein JTB14_034559 [Gonioctena quinquepunctata]
MIQEKSVDLEKLWSTIEPQNLVDKAYPKLVEEFNDEDDDLDLSDIVEGIISRKPEYIKDNLKKNNFQLDMVEVENMSSGINCNASSFFITNPVEDDMFEQSLNVKEDSGESTEEYEFDENVCLKNVEGPTQSTNSNENNDNYEEDSFCDIYIPLLERLKNK